MAADSLPRIPGRIGARRSEAEVCELLFDGAGARVHSDRMMDTGVIQAA